MSVTRIAGHCRLHNKSPNFLTTRHPGIFLGAYFLRKLEVSSQRFVPKKFPGWMNFQPGMLFILLPWVLPRGLPRRKIPGWRASERR